MEEQVIKATSAAYRLLDFLPDGDPLKTKAKEKALAILDSATLLFDEGGWVSLKKYLVADRQEMITRLLDDIALLQGYLTIAKHQGWMSDMNFLIISKEYDHLKERVSQSKGLIRKDYGSPTVIAREDQPVTKPLVKTPLKEDIISQKAMTRQEKILEILKNKEKAQVADIIKEIPNITKRTVRRDLDELLKRDKIQRVGSWNQVSYKVKGVEK